MHSVLPYFSAVKALPGEVLPSYAGDLYSRLSMLLPRVHTYTENTAHLGTTHKDL